MRATRTAVTGLTVLTGLLALALTGCGTDERDRFDDRVDELTGAVPSCVADGCVPEVDALRAPLAALPGVEGIEALGYLEASATDGASVGGRLVVAPGVVCQDLAERVAELAWRSSVAPLDAVQFQCVEPGAAPQDGPANNLSALVRPASEDQLAAWGERGTLGR
ncbi:hypothetical protein [Nocardioides sp.]|uniref:hypothetical protein n=1 Tax=Nocardioides sp. TaxID=35761 RepID=UPI003515D436